MANGNGDSHNEEKIRKTADAALLVLSARLMAVIGVPFAGFICVQAYLKLDSIYEKLIAQGERITVIEQKQLASDNRDNSQDGRLDRLEDRVFIRQP